MTLARRWAPLVAFGVLAAAWLTANILGVRAYEGAVSRANAIMLAAEGHVATSGPAGTAFWMPFLLHGLLPAAGAAALAVALRASRRGLWFLAAGALPFAISGSSTYHGWFRPGPGIDTFTNGAGFGSVDLDLTTYGAGPTWLLWAGTALTVAVALVPALLTSPPSSAAEPARSVRAAAVAALPYAILVGMAALTFLGVKGATTSGGDMVPTMLLGGAAAAVAVLAGAVLLAGVRRHTTWLVTAGMAIVAVGAGHPGAQPATQLGVALAAVGCAGVALLATRRPFLTRRPTEA
jgi:hypothetical protein